MNEMVETALVRRFETPDLSRHGKWILPRLMKLFNLTERAAAGFIGGLSYNNEYMFLYQPHGAALAQVVRMHTLQPKPIVIERFVWVENPDDKNQVQAAAAFYDEFHRWAKTMDADTIIVEEMTDVPHDLIKQKLGRIFTRQQQFAKV